MGTDVRAAVWAKTNGHCWYCGKLMNPWDDFTVDHMDPRKQGGGDELPNLVPACKSCNSRKNAKTVIEYKAYLQEKQLITFWFESSEHLLAMYDNHVAPIDEEEEETPNPYIDSLEEYLYACMRVGLAYSHGFFVTLLWLMTEALQNFEKDDQDSTRATGQWFFLMEELALSTCQSIDNVFGHLMTLQNQEIIEITWNEAPRNGHLYEFNFHTMMDLDHSILETRRLQRIEAKRLEEIHRQEERDEAF